ncbi:MAG: HlyD family secretion protein, partial [Candidatus Bipolaricaulota bacterium]|nr:HlyD family secretion protein [Candidatus Bipolaricaulota bacterium]
PLVFSLPSLSGLLVKPGDRVEEGEPIARRVEEAPLRDLEDQAQAKAEEAARLEGELSRAEERCRAEREALRGELARLRDEVGRLRYLVSVGAEAPIRLAEAEGRLEEARGRLTRLALDCAGDRARLEASLREARLDEERLRRRLARAEEAQLVRSPVAGRVAEVKVRDITPKGGTVLEAAEPGELEGRIPHLAL